ncbi:MAG TPA: ribosome-associated translation inhibitor RaiA [Thermoanaerobaculia bacterium]|nr:ribosome-associated translation inhibitor RaiA [Thermoanaerobaculia bacterium]
MNIEYIGRNFHIDEPVKQHVATKLGKLLKFLEEPIEARATLFVEKHRHIAEIHVAHRHGVFQATEETGLMLEAINQAIEKIESQARRSREKLVDRKRHADKHAPGWPVEVLDRTSVDSGTPRVIESIQLTIKPMTIEEAALALDGAEDGVVVFRDATTDRLSVLYRRKDNNYGLIAPEL